MSEAARQEKSMRRSCAIDRNVWQYLTDATSGAYDPAPDTTRVREERLAALRVALYAPSPLWITPSVHAEFERIGDRPMLWRDNAGIRDVFFYEVQARDLDAGLVAARTNALRLHHGDAHDCRAIAEAEAAGVEHFLSRDKTLLKRLGPRTTLTLMPPSAYWHGLAVPRGAEPRVAPAPTNPLSMQSWWRW